MAWPVCGMLRDVFLFPIRARACAHARTPEGRPQKSSRNYPHIPVEAGNARLSGRTVCGMCRSDIPHIPQAHRVPLAREVRHA